VRRILFFLREESKTAPKLPQKITEIAPKDLHVSIYMRGFTHVHT